MGLLRYKYRGKKNATKNILHVQIAAMGKGVSCKPNPSVRPKEPKPSARPRNSQARNPLRRHSSSTQPTAATATQCPHVHCRTHTIA